MEMIISITAESHGYGSEPYKWCSGLTKEERTAVKSGQVVVYEDDRLSNGNSGHYLRQALHNPRGGYVRTVANDELVAEYERITGRTIRYTPMPRDERNQQQRQARKEHRIAVKERKEQERALFNKIHHSPALTPKQAFEQGLIAEFQLRSFGYDTEEHEELINESSLRVHNGNVVVFQAAIERTGWRPHLVVAKFRGPIFTTGYWTI